MKVQPTPSTVVRNVRNLETTARKNGELLCSRGIGLRVVHGDRRLAVTVFPSLTLFISLTLGVDSVHP
jgi:hypothetical protein